MTPRKQVTYSNRPNHATRAAHRQGERQFKTYDTSHIRPKKSKAPIIVAIILAIVVIGGLAFGGYMLVTSFAPATVETLAEGESVKIEIPEGSGAKAIGDLLLENRVIADSNAFVNQVSANDLDAALKPGSYTFTGPLTLDEVIDQLVAGPNANSVSLTIPEGYTIPRTAEAVAQVTEGRVSAEDFTAAANNAAAYEADYPFVAGVYNNTLEGFLFPKTYPIDENSTADSIIRQMLSQYQTEVATLDYAYAESQGLTPYDVLKLASMIEKEADSETRGKVSSVFHNRLAIAMPLQSDATTAFEVGREPTAEDVATDGPYNTYTNPGLPPSPICSPGLASLQAALAPESTPYLYFYFVPGDDGKLVYYFSETYEEHNDAIANG